MRKIIPSYVRIPLLFALVFMGLEYFIDSGDKPAFMVYPAVPVFLGLFLLILIAIEIINNAFDNVTYMLMSEEQKKLIEEQNKIGISLKDSPLYKKIMGALTKSKPIEEEGELLMEHNYDGIQELDNVLPPWWIYLFYICIFFGIGYLGYYHFMGGENQHQEYERKNSIALAEIEEWKKTAKDLIDASTVTLLTEDADLNAGKAIYMEKCVACHLADGGGSIGPNLTDQYWILGGGIKEVFHTISEGGREGKGMIPWKSELKPSQIQQVASYILSLGGTTPAVAKEPEGEIWASEDTTTASEVEEVEAEAIQIR
jgi:cytochrome c oxidase cbb3-type subunit 3